MSDSSWEVQFKQVYDRALKAYAEGNDGSAEACIPAADRAFLATLGCTAQELFDFVEDGHLAGEPSFEEVLAVTRLRQDYFTRVEGGRAPGRPRSAGDFPPKSAAVDGIAWLPRLLAKAHAKLEGKLPPELMYGCGGDRPFLRGVRVGLAEFLQAVRDAGGDDRPVIELVKRRLKGGA